MSRKLRPLVASIVTISVLVAVSCSKLPTEPDLATAPSAGVSAPVSSPTDGAATDPALLGLLEPPAQFEGDSVTITRTIGLLGGVALAGDFAVVVPPGALHQQVSVTVTQPEVDELRCDLKVTPESANHFSVPVLLVVDCTGRLSKNQVAKSYLSWFNPATGKWEKVAGSSIDLKLLRVSAPLSHFSQYRVETGNGGRAGW